MTICYIGLGSNLNDPETQIHSALNALGKIPQTTLVTSSSLYRSRPLGPENQPEYINAVARLETALTAVTLLRRMQQIESDHGRRRRMERWGPRTLDLDLLLYGNEQINEQQLVIPHPEMANRNFVLSPLLEIAPDITIPGLGPARPLLDRIGSAGLEKVTQGE